MKIFYIAFALIFYFHLGFGQIAFNEIIVTDVDSGTSFPSSVYAADLDGDGYMDVLSSSRFDDKIAWYKNINGEGSFSSQIVITTDADNATSVFASDVDGDGDMDVLSASYSDDKIAWYENTDGLGNFGNQQIISNPVGGGAFGAANGPTSVFASDIDGDGDMDVLSTSYVDDKIAWYENVNGLGNFGTQQIIASGLSGVRRIYTSDIDNDGDMDINVDFYITNPLTGRITWFENIDGQGNFGPRQDISVGETTSNTADIDGDGDKDIVSGSRVDNNVVWFENINGQGNMGPKQIITELTDGTTSVYSADIDNDGDMDVVSASENDDKIAWYENMDGAGNFGSQQIISSLANGAVFISTIDLDNDGDIDVLSASYNDDKIAWYENIDGLGDFSEEKIIVSSVDGASSIFVSDIDGDGDADILSASINDDKIAWFENTNGQGNFNVMKTITNNADGAVSVFASDIDGDGDMDALSGSAEDRKIAWYENIDGQGDFGPQQVISINVDRVTSIYAVDIDNDGDMDIVSTSSNNDKVAWYENMDAQGDFSPQQIISIQANSANSVFAVDIDNDSDMDLLVGIYDTIVWFENIDGQGNFGSQQVISQLASGLTTVYAADIDNDDDMDVFSTSEGNNRISWYENIDGQGNFGAQQYKFGSDARSVFASDIDGDGYNDMIAGVNNSDKVIWFKNDSQGGFGEEQLITSNLDGLTSIYISDVDGDGDIDVLSSSKNDDKILLNKNLGILGNEINGLLKFDFNNDGCDDMDDIFVPNILISTNNGNDSFSSFSQNDGYYRIAVNQGSFNTQLENFPNYYTSNPISQISDFVGLGNTDTVDFCIEPSGVFNDLTVSIYPSIDEPRPGFDTSYQIVCKNIGTTQLSGSVSFQFDDSKIQFLSASETVSSQTTDSLSFDFVDFNPFETKVIDLEFNVFAPPTANIDDVLISTATVNPVSGDETEDDNIFTLEQIVIGSYDPNDITVLQGEEIFIEDANKYLNYLIRFQNTGTASAINVRVEHVLDDKLDWTTMQLESLSHSGRVEIENETDVSFIFNNINLPDSTSNEQESHGYIAFKIKPKSNVQIGDIISGVADIYFDFNPPIITNTVNTEIVPPLSIDDQELDNIKLYPNPTSDKLRITSQRFIDGLKILDINGRMLKIFDISPIKDYTLDVSSLSKGIYFLEIRSGESRTTTKFIKN
ncbi:T9SS type A sorting domain-containing protein [Winogradskyella sp.]|uniref:T9SS type A sorting domain-containing protein n=1 Tax=Winogradskyella sp. TaxID=1883156 RepID=UPI0026221F8B|nr:T9SS type A sorting domain-containing protein [Winogradskyella sp.]